MENRVLRDRAMRRGRDGRNPYGSRGGYVVSSRRGRGRGRDRAMDSEYNYPERDSRYNDRNYADRRGQDYHMGYEQSREHNRPMEYEMYGIGGIVPRNGQGNYMEYRRDYGDYADYDYDRINMRDYGYDSRRGGRRDYGDYGDYADYDYAKEDEEYKKDLKEWIDKLKGKDKYKMTMEQLKQEAKKMDIKFEKYDEMELYATYLMMISDYPQMAGEPHSYIAMAKAFLEDKDAALQGGEKLCKYLYAIVLDED